MNLSYEESVRIGLTLYLSILGPPGRPASQRWSGGPGSLVRGAEEKLYTPDRLSAESCPG